MEPKLTMIVTKATAIYRIGEEVSQGNKVEDNDKVELAESLWGLEILSK